MSMTASRGLMDAGRWTTVAVTVAEHVSAVQAARKAHQNLPSAPAGALNAAGQFLKNALKALDRTTMLESHGTVRDFTGGAPTMVGISSLSIAVNVIRSAQGVESAGNVDAIRGHIDALSRSLDQLETPSAGSIEPGELQRLGDFFRELGRTGRVYRAASLASNERPLRR